MHFKRIVSVAACCLIIKFGFVKSQSDETEGAPAKSKEDVEDEVDLLVDSHTFVALIDVVFPDGTKRTCTGTIIHDNVVLTVAHCFVHDTDDKVQPELTASFVVIGTRKMYEAGYEQYLPIERILTHPKYEGWTADLSLVYTFAGMTSDKPGKIIRIAGEKVAKPVDSNLTVYSWGHTKKDEIQEDKWKEIKMTPCGESSSIENDDRTVGIDLKRARLDSFFPVTQGTNQNPIDFSTVQKGTNTEVFREDILYKFPTLREKVKRGKETLSKNPLKWQPSPMKMSRYLSSEEDRQEEGIAVIYLPQNSQNKKRDKPRVQPPSVPFKADKPSLPYGYEDKTKPKRRTTSTRFRTINRNWRRSMGTQENKLTVNNFGFVNAATCKKIVESVLSPRSEYKSGEVVCYHNDEHYLTDDDSGAPAIRHSQLVAVTVGGAESEGQHAGIGLRMSCYCSWISDNLPGGVKMNCCKNCCDVKHTESASNPQNMKRNRKNKYIF